MAPTKLLEQPLLEKITGAASPGTGSVTRSEHFSDNREVAAVSWQPPPLHQASVTLDSFHVFFVTFLRHSSFNLGHCVWDDVDGIENMCFS